MLLVVGATGNIGRHLVPELASRGAKVRTFTRGAATPWGPDVSAAVEPVQGDLADDAAVAAALDGVDRVFVTTPGSAQQAHLEAGLFRAAAAAGVQHVVKVSVIGADEGHFVPYARYHAVAEKALTSSGLPATVLRPNWFMENFLGSAATIAGQGTVYGSAGAGRVAFVDSRDTAAVAAHVLTAARPAVGDLVVTGPQALTFAEAAEQIGAGLGRPVGYVDLGDEDFAGALTGAGLPSEVAADVVAIMRNAREGNLRSVTSTVTDLLGRPARGLAEWAADNAAAFTPQA